MPLSILRSKPTLLALALIGAGLALTGCARDPEKRSLGAEAVSNAKSMARTDADMQKVLDKFASFDP